MTIIKKAKHKNKLKSITYNLDKTYNGNAGSLFTNKHSENLSIYISHK